MQRREFIGRSSIALIGGAGGFLKPGALNALERAISDASDNVNDLAQDDAFWMRIRKSLRARGIIVQDKSGKYSPFSNAIRVSPGVYTTTAELDLFVRAFGSIG